MHKSYLLLQYSEACKSQSLIKTSLSIEVFSDLKLIYAHIVVFKYYYLLFIILLSLCILKCKESPTGTTISPQAQELVDQVPVLITPETNSEKTTKVLFKWGKVKNVESYKLNLSESKDFKTILVDSTIDSTTVRISNLPQNTSIYWRVGDNIQGREADWSETRKFKTSAKPDSVQTKKLAAPKQLAPSDKVKDTKVKPNFSWQAVDGANAYELHVSIDDKIIFKQHVDKAGFKPDVALSEGKTYYWRVRAIDGGINGKWSGIHSFTTIFDTTTSASEAPITTQLQAPRDKAKDLSVNAELQWNKVAGSSEYKVQLADGEQFKSLIVDESLKTTSYKLSDLKHGKDYAWRVKPIVPDKKSKWSDVYTFTTSTPAVILLTPDDGASEQPVNLSLRWQSLSGISQYHVQVAPENSFASPVVDKKIDGATYKALKLDNEKIYYWRVQASDDENSGNWSTIRSFRTEAAPDDGRTTTSADRQSLMDMYQATDGAHWTNNHGWGKGDPSDGWYGIKTNAQGRVIGIDLFKNNLKGQLPKSIGNLDKVTYLNVKNNYLTGNIPSSIGNMASLRVLILQGRTYEIGGTLKEPNMDHWDYAYHQGKHYSNTNTLSGTIPATIGNLSNLEVLEIANAPDIKGPIPTELGKLSKLKGLYLSFDDFSGTSLPSSLGNLRNLKHLYIASAQLTGKIPASFENLTGLIYLNLGESSSHTADNHLTGDIPDFSKFTSLRSIVITNNNLTGVYPKYWNNGNFRELVTLRFSWNKLTGTLHGFDKLPALESFGVEGNKLSGTIDKQLTQLPKRLQILGLGWNNFSGRLPQNGWPDFKQLKTLYLNNNNLSGGIPCDFWKKVDNPRLGICSLGHNKFDSNCTRAMDKVTGNITGGTANLDISIKGNNF